MPSLAPVLYDARGNRYVVASPDQINGCGVDVKAAAQSHQAWARDAILALCHPDGVADAVSDGLIIGPFDSSPPLHALIVNTDGSLAERSGNGLTIFAQALRDAQIVEADAQFDVHVHHATPGQPSPVAARLTITDESGAPGVWVAMGQPEFGPDGVAARADIAATSTPRRNTNHVAALADVHERWTDSVLVRIGNPHCVTWVSDEDELPDFDALGTPPWYEPLKAIAFVPSVNGACHSVREIPAFAHGINLQWAARVADDQIVTRIFERGEGPTRSSGSSATAVACSGRQLGLTTAEIVKVVMPGGTALIRFEDTGDDTFVAHYLGTAERVL